jgi:putative glutamine amidotransferase
MTRTVALLIGREPAQRYSVHRGYADAVWEAGAVPVLLTPPALPAAAGHVVDRHVAARYVEVALGCDAVCVTGGGDVDPSRYGEVPSADVMDVDPVRDGVEIATVLAARDRGIPVLGICRGIQLVAVALGGRLHQDLRTAGYEGHWEEDRHHEPVHAIECDAGTLASVALAGATIVNSIHHQAVRDPGPALTPTAWGPGGLIEAVEAPGLLGIQWHPERLLAADPRHLAPFRWLVAA